MSTESPSFLQAYQQLDNAANALRTCNDLDKVATHIQEGVKAFHQCQSRIEAVRKMIGELPVEGNDAAKVTQKDDDVPDFDDDIPL